jgi:hypothetical protein
MRPTTQHQQQQGNAPTNGPSYLVSSSNVPSTSPTAAAAAAKSSNQATLHQSQSDNDGTMSTTLGVINNSNSSSSNDSKEMKKSVGNNNNNSSGSNVKNNIRQCAVPPSPLLIEYVACYGHSNDTFSSTGQGAATLLDHGSIVATSLICRAPKENHEKVVGAPFDRDFPLNVDFFAFPNGLKLYRTKQQSFSHSFVLTLVWKSTPIRPTICVRWLNHSCVC